LNKINVYPVKSLLGFSPARWQLSLSGLQYDRQWMVVQKNGKFLTQRNTPVMTQIKAEIDGDLLVLTQKNTRENISMGKDEINNETISVNIWRQDLDAQFVNKEVNGWLSDHLHKQCYLVTIQSGSRTTQSYGGESMGINFNDRYPILISSIESLENLNKNIGVKLSMNRFRPNLILSGGNGTEEEDNEELKIGNIPVKLSKPCIRCRVICTDQDTGEMQMEILSKVKKVKSLDNQAIFGINAIPRGEGILNINDLVTF
jgi:uncharacterized protein YcbX